MTSSSGASGGPSTWSSGPSGRVRRSGTGRVILEWRAAVADIEFLVLLLAVAALRRPLRRPGRDPVPDRARASSAWPSGCVPGLPEVRARPRRRLPRLPAAAAARRGLARLAARAAQRDAAARRAWPSGSCWPRWSRVAVVAHAIVPGMSWAGRVRARRGRRRRPTRCRPRPRSRRIGVPRAGAAARRGRGDDQRRRRPGRLPGRARRGGRRARSRPATRRWTSSSPPSAASAIGLAVGWAPRSIVRRQDGRRAGDLRRRCSPPTRPTSSPRRLHVSGVLAARRRRHLRAAGTRPRPSARRRA